MRKKEGKKLITFSLNRFKIERRTRCHVAMVTVPKFLDLNKPWSPIFFPDEPKLINRIVKRTTKIMRI